jgi:hypothetical protein
MFKRQLDRRFPARGHRKCHFGPFSNSQTPGIVIINFPTPTILYGITQIVAGILGLWILHDEAPLSIGEVLNIANKAGDVLEC